MTRLLKPTAFKISLAVGLAFAIAHLMRKAAHVRWHYLDLLEEKAIDWKFAARGSLPLSHKVALVAVDEKSIQKDGLWPWNRALVGRAIENLDHAGAASIALDMDFTDPDRNSAFETFGALRQRLAAPDPGADVKIKSLLSQVPAGAREPVEALAKLALDEHARFAAAQEALDRALLEAPDVALARAVEKTADKLVMGTINMDPAEVQFASEANRGAWEKELAPSFLPGVFAIDSSFSPPRIKQTEPAGAGSSAVPAPLALQGWLPSIAAKGQHFAFFSLKEDPDGTMRRYTPVVRHGEGFYPALAIQAVAAAFHSSIYPLKSDISPGNIQGVALYTDDGLVVAPVDDLDGHMLINFITEDKNWHGPDDRVNGRPACRGATCDRISMSDAVDGAFDPATVAGKVVFVGVTAIGTFDQRVTPFDPFGPGVFTHLNVAEDVISHRFLEHPGYLTIIEALLLVALGVLFGLAIPRLAFAWQFAVFPVGSLAYLAGDYLAFRQGTQFFTVTPLAEMALLSFAVIFFQYASTDREKRQIRQAFQYYLTESVMEEMLQDPSKLKLGGEKKELTVLFSDIRGFTTLSEMLEASEVAKTLNEYLTPMTDLVFQHGGTLDKYMGDAIMAFWGAPVDQPDHALRACQAAVEMLATLEVLRKKWQAMERPEIDIGIGLNSGLIHVGNMGSDVRFDYTVIGDDVNLASRLEGTNKTYGTRIIIGEGTYRLVKGKVVARELGGVVVKGKRKPVTIYELRGMGEPAPGEKEIVSQFEQGLAAYRARSWDAAEACFKQVLASWAEDGPSEKYLDDIQDKRVHPPPEGWDGVYVMKTK